MTTAAAAAAAVALAARSAAAYRAPDSTLVVVHVVPLLHCTQAYARSACAVHGTADSAADRRRVGLAFLRGEGVDRNTAVAAHFLREAAELGDAAAQCWLATCYAEGWGVRPDQNEAANLYAVSARSGYARAQNNLAVCYADGIHLTASQPLTEFPKPHHAG